MTIFDIIDEYGPICAADENMGYLVSVNGSYLNLWVESSPGRYANIDCSAMPKNLYEATGAEMIDLAEQALKEWTSPPEDE